MASPSPVKAVLVALISLMVIQDEVAKILAFDPVQSQKVNVEDLDELESGVSSSLTATLEELRATDFGRPGALDRVRDTLERRRAAINGELFLRNIRARTAWAPELERWLKYATLLLLLLLLGPVVVWRRRGSSDEALATVPWFLACTAGLLVVVRAVTDVLVGVQVLQITAASFGAPNIAMTDALIHYLVLVDDPEVHAVVSLIAQSRQAFEVDPFGALGMVRHLFDGAAAAAASEVLTTAAGVVRTLSSAFELYGPAMALATLWIAWGVLKSLITTEVRAAFEAVEADEPPRVWPFVKTQLGIFWRELVILLWMLLFIALLTLAAVVMVRLLVIPPAIGAIKTVLAVQAQLQAGGALPEWGVLLAVAALGIYVALATLLCIGPLGIALGHTYDVVRDRKEQGRRYRDYPAWGPILREALVSVMGVTVLLAAAVTGAYLLLLAIVHAPIVRIHATTLLFGVLFPVLATMTVGPKRLLLLWRREVIPPATE